MRYTLAGLFLSVFFLPVCDATETLTHEIDKQATARVPWEIGEIVGRNVDPENNTFNIKFFGITSDGDYLVQEFYSYEGEKRTDPYLMTCPKPSEKNQTKDDEKFWKSCGITGPLTGWHKNGKKQATGHYQKGEQHGHWTTWHDNGQKMKEGYIQEGKAQGLWTYWHPNGQKEQEGHYRNGKEQDTWIWWNADGKKEQEGRFKNGEQKGLWIRWDENGKELMRKKF